MKVWIDQDLCTGDGLCEEIAPAVFTLLDDGLAYVKEGDKVFSDPGGPEGRPAGPAGRAAAGIGPPGGGPAEGTFTGAACPTGGRGGHRREGPAPNPGPGRGG